MDILLLPLIEVIDIALGLYLYAILASAIMSWLVAFGIVNTANLFVHRVGEFLTRITDPALDPIRRFLPYLGGIDISPIILILAIVFLRSVLARFASMLM